MPTTPSPPVPSRRAFVKGALAVCALTAAGTIADLTSDWTTAFAGNEGGGGAGAESGPVQGGSGAGSADGQYWFWHLWHDRGGFVDAGSLQPEQGWDDASAQWFLDQFNKTNRHDRILSPTGYPLGGPYAYVPYPEIWMRVGRQALDRARARSGQAHARIIGAACYYYPSNRNSAYNMLTRTNMGEATWQNLMGRPGNKEELPDEHGWGDIVDGYSVNWRQQTWNWGAQDNPGNEYMVLMVAVADGEPPANIDIPVTKVWSNDSAYTSNRPSSVTVTIVGSGGTRKSLTLTAAGGWRGTFENLPSSETYMLEEDKVAGYDFTLSGDADSGFTATNTLRLTQASVRKIWNDRGFAAASSVRPSAVTVELTGSDGSRRTATLNANNNWSHTWTGLLETMSNGKTVTYSVREVDMQGLDANWQTTYGGSLKAGFTITNELVPGEANVNKDPIHDGWS